MLGSDQNCLVEKCVQMSCNNTSNKSNDIAKDKITNSNSNKKKKHKKNGLINGVTSCQQVADSTTTATQVEEQQQINGLVINDNSEAKTITQLDSNDNISTDKCKEFCELLNNSKDDGDNGESMACCSDSRIDQQLEGCEIDSLTHNLNKIDLVEETNKLDDDKRKNLPLIKYVQYESELQMPMIMKIIQKDLSEPYSIYTYRYFIHNWPKLCFLAMCEDQCVGAIVCKLDIHRKLIKRGYIAMLAVDQNYRKLGIGSTLVRMAIKEMILGDADEVVLETEVTNQPALQLYEALGFVRDKRLFRYYLNGVDALRLKLWLR